MGRLSFKLFRSYLRNRPLIWRVSSQVWSILVMTGGSLLVALASAEFTIPYRFIDGGIFGVAILTSYFFPVKPGLLVLLLNVPLLFWAYRELEKSFVVYTLYCTALFSFALDILKELHLVQRLDDLLLVSLYGGVLKGVGGALVLWSGGSLAGLDILGSILRRRYGIEIGKGTFAVNLVIVSIASLYLGVERGMYTLVSMYVGALVMDGLLTGFSRKKLALVITSNPDVARGFVLYALRRGATVLEGRGAYTGEVKHVVMVSLTPRQLIRLKRHLAERDPTAFVVVQEASEVLGSGFSPLR